MWGIYIAAVSVYFIAVVHRTALGVAGVEALAGLVAGLDTAGDTAVFVGHNEGLEDFATFLSGEQVTLKTSSYAVLTSDAPWTAWPQQSAALNEVVVAR